MYKKLFTHLLNTRESLHSSCLSLDIDLSSVDITILDTYIVSCCNCGIWSIPSNCMFDCGMPVCDFCQDMQLLRF